LELFFAGKYFAFERNLIMPSRQLDERSLQTLQEQSNEAWFRNRKEQKPKALVGIAEGDSWFDYAPAWLSDLSLGDLINQLNQHDAFNILRIAKAGDYLENMTFGSTANGKFKSKSPQLEKTLEFIERYQPDFFLFSGGGNDVAGPDGLKFEPFLNHGKSNLPHLRQSYFDLITREVIPEMFEYLIQSIIAKKSDIRIFLHGYGYPIPDGRAVELAGFEFAGPWFEPALTRKNLTQADGQVIVTKLIDALNEGIAQLAAKYPKNVHHIDLRKIIQDSDWENELHLYAKGFQKVAKEFERQILS
jgi:lysophospholipase L1-like esterase